MATEPAHDKQQQQQPEQQQPTKLNAYTGHCHCGANAWKTELDSTLQSQNTISCNCSICLRNGYLFIYPHKDQVAWTAGGMDNMTVYNFGKQQIAHYFCKTCGTSLIAVSSDPNFSEYIGLNLRAVPGLDIQSLKLHLVDNMDKPHAS